MSPHRPASCRSKTILTPVNGSATRGDIRSQAAVLDVALHRQRRSARRAGQTEPTLPRWCLATTASRPRRALPIQPPVLIGRQGGASDGGHRRQRRDGVEVRHRPGREATTSRRRPCIPGPQRRHSRRTPTCRASAAAASAAATGARSAALISLSQPHPIDRLHTAPGNCRSTASNSWPIFSYAPSPSTVGRALTTTFCASGAIACATSRSITVSAPDGPG